MRLTICLTARPWPRALPGVIIIVIILLITFRVTPGAVLPLGLGGWLGAYLGTSPAAARRIMR
jgi:hypothetical protein